MSRSVLRSRRDRAAIEGQFSSVPPWRTPPARGDVGAGGLVGDLGHPGRRHHVEALAQLVGRERGAHRGEHVRRHERSVAVVDCDQVAVVDGEVALIVGEVGVGGHPLLAHRHARHRQLVLVHEVPEHRGAVPGSRHHPLRADVLAVVEHGAEEQARLRLDACHRCGAGGEHPDSELLGGGDPLRARRAEQERDVDGPGGAEPGRVHHPHLGPLPRHDLAAQEASERAHVVGDERPPQWPLAEREAAGEPGADGHRHALGADEVDERGDRRGIGHRVAQARDQDPRPEPDRRRPVGAARQRRPHVRVQRR